MENYPENLQMADDWLTEQMIMDGCPKPYSMSEETYEGIKKYGHSWKSVSKKEETEKN